MAPGVAAVERKWFAVAPDGIGRDALLRVSVAADAEPTGEWAVVVSLEGLESSPHRLYGVDKWQALVIGLTFAAQRVRDLSQRGWTFFWERGGYPATVEDLGLG